MSSNPVTDSVSINIDLSITDMVGTIDVDLEGAHVDASILPDTEEFNQLTEQQQVLQLTLLSVLQHLQGLIK